MRREVVARKAALDELRNSSFTLVAGRLQGALGGRCGLPLCRYRIQLAACSWEPAPLRSLAGERGARGERVEGGSFTFGDEDPCWHFWLTRITWRKEGGDRTDRRPPSGRARPRPCVAESCRNRSLLALSVLSFRPRSLGTSR